MVWCSSAAPGACRTLALLILLAAAILPPCPAAVAQSGGHPSTSAEKTKTIVPHRSFDRADGLPHATIQALAQAPDGRLWIGTNAGLAVYDGHEIRPAPLPDSLENAFVCTIQAQTAGTVWVTLKGRGIVALRNGRVERVEPHLWEGEGACPSGLLARGDTAVVATEQSFRVLPPRADTVLHTPYTFASTADRAAARRVWAGRADSLHIESVTQGPDGRLWGLDHRRGLARLNSNGTIAFVDGAVPDAPPKFWWYLATTPGGRAYVSTSNGLYRVRPSTETIRKISPHMYRWFYTRGSSLYGIHKNTAVHWDLRTGRRRTYSPALGLPDTQYYAVLEDDRGGLWIGTQRGLLFLPAPSVRNITTIDGTDLRWTTDLVRNPTRESVWLSTWGFGLFRLSPSPTHTDPAQKISPSQDVRSNWVLTSRDHPGGVDAVGPSGWIRKGTGDWRVLHPDVAAVGGSVDSTGAGVFWSDHGILRVRPSPTAPIDTLAQWPRDAFPYHHFRLLGDGTLLYRAREHFIRLSLVDPTVADTVATVPQLADVRAGTMVVLDDHVWLGTGTEGLLRLHRDRETVTQLLSDQRVKGLSSAGDSLLLAGTNDGLYLVDAETDRIRRRLTTADGLLSNTAQGQFIRDTLYVRHLYGASMLPRRAALASLDPPRPKITGLSVNGASHRLADSLRLDVGDRTLQFHFSGVHLSKGADVRHDYRLTPYDTTWHTTAARQTRYTDLEPGQYTFQVRAHLKEGPASDPVATQVALPPAFYETAWFWWLCGLAGLGLLVGGYRLRVRALRRRKEQLQTMVAERTNRLAEEKEKTEAQAERLAAIDEEKNRFFANISHELRTPLTLLVGSLQEALDGVFGDPPAPLRQQLEVMTNHVDRIRRLADQLLDLSRLETTDPGLDPEPRDLVAFVRELVQAFAPLADRRCIDFALEARPDAHPCRFDPDKLQKVVDNLLSNALKFTPEGGSVTVRLDVESSPADDTAPTAVLQVEDNGPGIPEDQQERIFKRFALSRSQEGDEPGTGLGLALAREFAELHGGTLHLDSTPGVGSTFTVRLPLPPADPETVESPAPPAARSPSLLEATPQTARGNGIPDPDGTPTETPETGSDAPVLLVAEDNDDVRAFLRRRLRDRWTVVEAADGAEALDTARREDPDLLLADVMMPELDGIALTRRLRKDETVGRLPILLLTARAGEEDAVVGLEAGADDYVTKPFSIDELRARLERLLETRGGQTAPDASPALLTPNVDLTPANEEFLGRVTDTIEAHLSRSSLTVDDLADEVGISARQLQRKLKDLTGHTAAEFVCRYRLDCAAELLEAGADSISQVAYRVGFGTPDTFVQHFRKHFDCAPSEYAERHGTTDAAPSS